MSDLPVNITGNVPDKTMGRLGEALADLISPITETTGLIGDSLRFHREQMAQRRIAAAQAKAQQLNAPTQKLPYKYVVRWMEAATLENEDSSLNELWENLLVAGMTKYEDYLEMFVSILTELGGSEVAVLKKLADRYSTLDGAAELVPAKGSESRFYALFEPALENNDANGVWREVLSIHDSIPQTGFHLVGAIATSGEGGQRFYYHELYSENFVAFELLSRERLIDINKAQAPKMVGGDVFQTLTATLTQLGTSFVSACLHPEKRIGR